MSESIFKKLVDKGFIKDYPKFLSGNIHYETLMGSIAYGVSTNSSDIDIYGFCTPPKEMIFPHEFGYIHKLGTQPPNFDQFQQNHIKGDSNNKEYDISIYNIVKYFNLCMECNPNIIDSLFAPDRCIMYMTDLGLHVRENRKLFLNKEVWRKFRGYSQSQITKLSNSNLRRFCDLCKDRGWPLDVDYNSIRNFDSSIETRNIFKQIGSPDNRSKRLKVISEHGYDLKYAYHAIRLLEELYQILETGDLDVSKNKDMLKSIRNGEWEEDKIYNHLKSKTEKLETLYQITTLPEKPDEKKIKKMFMECMELQFQKNEKPPVINVKPKESISENKGSDIDGLLDVLKTLERSRKDINDSLDNIMKTVIKHKS